MKGTEFAAYIRRRTKTDSTSFSDAAILSYANVDQEELTTQAISKKESLFERVATTSLVAGQREYAFPNDMLSGLKIAEVTLDGVEWARIYPFDLNEYRTPQTNTTRRRSIKDVPASFSTATTDEDTITDLFSDEEPMYDIAGGTMKLFTGSAIENVADGLKVSYTQYPADLVAADLASSEDLSTPTSSAFRLPRELHKAWALSVVKSYKSDNEIPLGMDESNIATIINEGLASLVPPHKDTGGVVPIVPRDAGFNY